ncbi:monooxygenase [Diplocarpon mali]|nr:monooxygenase [Diplocarpon mali]
MMGSVERDDSVNLDVIIVGAGISGINAGYRVQNELPEYQYTILEARNAIGGTWDLFRYPGIRSDSDLHTFGFSWRPWSKPNSIADGPSIRKYIRESAEINGIDKKIRFHHKLLSSDWSSSTQRWSLTVDANGEKRNFTARFVIFSTGYYDYETPLKASIPGIDKFEGKKIHPQFWPEDYDYTGKKIVIIGSGATAITLLPSLAHKAAQVTILQRSPSYIMALPAVDPMGDFVRKWLPTWVAHTIVRWKFLVLPFLFFKFCRSYPNAGRKIIRANTKQQLKGSALSHDPNFKPSYNPWEQRLCVCPDGDFFKALHRGNCDVVTDTIENVTTTGIRTSSGKTIDADVIITATGLKMQLAGGSRVTVDGRLINFADKFVWRGVMLQDIPNAAIVIGYTNASWTLGADATAVLVCRLLKHMDQNQQSSAVPWLGDETKLKPSPMLNLSSTYIEKAKGELPKAGDVAPWKPRANYLTDYWSTGYGNLTNGLQFSKSAKKVN